MQRLTSSLGARTRHKKTRQRHDNTGPYAAPPAFADMSQRSQTLGALLCCIVWLDSIRRSDFPVFYSDKWHRAAHHHLNRQQGTWRLKCFMIYVTMAPHTHTYWFLMQGILNASCIAAQQETNGMSFMNSRHVLLVCLYTYRRDESTSLIHHTLTLFDSQYRKYWMYYALLHNKKLANGTYVFFEFSRCTFCLLVPVHNELTSLMHPLIHFRSLQ